MQGLRQSLSPLRDNGMLGKDPRRVQNAPPVGRRNHGRGGSMLPPAAPFAESGRGMGSLFNESEAGEKQNTKKLQQL